ERFVGKLEVLRRLLDLQPDERVVLPLRLTFVFGLWVAFLALWAGARLTLLPRFGRSAVAGELASGEAVLAAVPTMLRMLSTGDATVAAPRTILTGGELLPRPLAEAIRERWPETCLFDLYGLTETGSCDFCLTPRDQPDGLGTIGRPTPGVTFRIAGEDGSAAVPGEPGELQIESRFGMLGYFDDPELSAMSFADGFFRTGDLAKQDDAGRVRIVGRIKEIVSRGGNKIAPAEIEALLLGHPAVEGALCAGVPDPLVGQSVHVLVVGRDGSAIDGEALLDWAQSRIERYKLPDAIHVVENLPVGPTGKLDRSAVEQVVGDRTVIRGRAAG
ncbi:MAG: fatty acid--CoA ligase family protein, partial [Geminicoccaceae bacterium]|nr:fatty acid--CoA ligase family protein [Geminicoccaceae bacterium]